MSEGSRWSRFLEASRSSLALIRELSILAVLAVLIINASWITPVLTKIGLALEDAGFTEITIGGVKQDLSRLRDKIEDTGLNTQQAQESLLEAKTLLKQVANAEPDTSFADSVNQAISQIVLTEERLGLSKRQIADITASPPSTDRTQVAQSSIPEREDQWIVVIGGDRTIEGAKDEVRRAADKGFVDSKILLLDGWYRTVLAYSSKSDAQAALPKISNDIREGAYVRNLATWCDKLTPTDSDDIEECT